MFVSTRSSKLKGDTLHTCETVTHQSHRPEKNAVTNNGNNLNSKVYTSKSKPKNKQNKDESNWNMKKLRYDIIKFGTSGFSGARKEESKIAFAISLGAQPRKNKFINYKELLKEKKAEKQGKTILKKTNKNKLLKKNKHKSKNKNKNGGKQLLDVYGRVQKVKSTR